ncbi:MAG: PKD domain-containing protein [Pyrinomonadaceae bacterium]|nr:PKD domain-containing protein [Pyrinomonadaceae bacterium]
MEKIRSGRDASTGHIFRSTLSHYWTFRDGTTSLSANPQKSYATAGTYNVSLRVRDNNGVYNTEYTTATLTSASITLGSANSKTAAVVGQAPILMLDQCRFPTRKVSIAIPMLETIRQILSIRVDYSCILLHRLLVSSLGLKYAGFSGSAAIQLLPRAAKTFLSVAGIPVTELMISVLLWLLQPRLIQPVGVRGAVHQINGGLNRGLEAQES